MGTFLTDGAAALPDVKGDLRPATGLTTEWKAEDANDIRQALLDLRTTALGFTTGFDSPNTAIVTDSSTATAKTLQDWMGKVQNLGIVNVKDFGAVGDGVVDDTAAFQLAVDEAAILGREIIIPQGTYKIGVGGITFNGAFRMRGLGNPVISGTDPEGKLFRCDWGSGQTGLTNFSLRDLTLTTTNVNLNPPSPFYLNWSLFNVTNPIDGGLIENVVFDTASSQQGGILLAPVAAGHVVQNVRVLNNVFTGPMTGATFFETTSATGPGALHNIEFRGNTVKWNGLGSKPLSCSMGVSFASAGKFFTICDNQIEGFEEAGLEIAFSTDPPSDIVIQGNHIEDTGFGIIFDSGGNNTARIQRASVVGNTIRGNRWVQRFNFLKDSVVANNVIQTIDAGVSATRVGAQLQLDYSDRVSFIGNRVEFDLPNAEYQLAMVSLNGWADGLFSGNFIRTNGEKVLSLIDSAGPTERNHFSGNKLVHRVGFTNVAVVGLYGGETRRNIFSGNLFDTVGPLFSLTNSPVNNQTFGNLYYDAMNNRFIERSSSFVVAATGATLDLTQFPDLGTDIKVVGTPGIDFAITVPDVDRMYTIDNQTAYTADVYVSGTNGIVIPAGATTRVRIGTGVASWGDSIPQGIVAGAAPTTGVWPKGSRVSNLNPSAGQPKGWICTVAGTPGTWVSEGNL